MRPIEDFDLYLVETLSTATLEDVANRLVNSHTFAELVYREAEMDALFTLADIGLHAGRMDRSSESLDGTASSAVLADVRDLVFAAHDLSHDGDVNQAAHLLREAGRLLNTAGPK